MINFHTGKLEGHEHDHGHDHNHSHQELSTPAPTPIPVSIPVSIPTPARPNFSLSNGNGNGSKSKVHAHFDCFSGAAGDMMLASCLDASHDPHLLLHHIENDLRKGIPEIANEFSLSVHTVWRGGMGSIAALKLEVESVYDHKAAPVPKDKEENKNDGDGGHDHSHGHGRSHDESKAEHVDGGSHDHQHGHDHSHEKVTHDHSHEHDDGHDHKHKHEQEQEHKHEHSHDHNDNKTPKQEEKDKEKQPPTPHDHAHEHSHSHSNSHDHGHDHSSGGPLRDLPQITKMLLASSRNHIPQSVCDVAIDTFTELAIAESYTHGTSSPNTVHFHEVGAIDSIVDVIGTLLALHYLGIDLHLTSSSVSCSRIPMGEGTVWTDHGQLPVPAFAAMRLLVGMKTCKGPGDKSGVVTGELVTPTAAALLRVLTGVAAVERQRKEVKKGGNDSGITDIRMGRPPNFTPRSVGLGAGTKDFVKHPNVIRLIVGDDVQDEDGMRKSSGISSKISADATKTLSSTVTTKPIPTIETEAGKEHHLNAKVEEHVTASLEPHNTIETSTTSTSTPWTIDKMTLLQANIDDITAEVLAYTLELLLKNGAVDAWVEPIVMKKGRSAHTLNCLFHSNPNSTNSDGDSIAGADGKLLEIIFRHTTTLGIRIQRDIERAALKRKMIQVQTLYGVENKEALNGVVHVKLGMMGEEVISVKAEFEDCKVISEVTGVPIAIIADYAKRKARDVI